MIYIKLSSISQHFAKAQELGKIINLLSNDFNGLENKVSCFFGFLVFPIVIITIIVLLLVRFGWPGILPICVVIGFLPFQILIAKIIGNLTHKLNINKDKRISQFKEIIEGIKFVKLYGWEIAF